MDFTLLYLIYVTVLQRPPLNCQLARSLANILSRSRVHGYTYRDDLQDLIITTSENWKKQPFHFRLYFDTLMAGNKGKTAYVLMIDVDRPSINIGIKFFQQWCDGNSTNLPNGLSYMFLPLYKKTYTDDERLKIISDHEHHVANDSVVAIQGLKPLNHVVKLTNGVYTTICKLLLSIPASGTTTNWLFIQVECQATNDCLLCCFHSPDAATVTVRLSRLEECLKKFVDNHDALFLEEHTIYFSGQVSPVNGRPRLPRTDVPEHINEYAMKSLKKLRGPTQKHLVTDMDIKEATTIPENPVTPTPQ